MKARGLFVVALFVAAAAPLVSLGGAASLVVEAGDKERLLVPMCVEVPAGARSARMTCQGREVPCQVADGRLWWILDRLPAGATRTYRVELGAKPRAQEPGVVIEKGEKSLAISIGGKPFTIYHFVPGAPAGVRLHRPCFFPVYGPDMVTMTRPYPLTKDVPANVSKDHPHHTSIWVAHGAVKMAEDIEAAAILTCTRSGNTTLRVARHRPRQVVLSLTPEHETALRMALTFGAVPVEIDLAQSVEELEKVALGKALQGGFVSPGDPVVLTAGVPFDRKMPTNMIKVITAEWS